MSESTKPASYWYGAPEACDICAADLAIEKRFFDAVTWHGSWAIMCPKCQEHGPGLNQIGRGRGQEYALQGDGRWMKVAG